MARRAADPRWMTISDALGSPDVTTEDRLAIAAALIEEEALRRAAVLFAGRERAWEWYVAHGGRFRFSEDGEQLMILIPVPRFALAAR